MFGGETTTWEFESICCELEREWREMGLGDDEINQALSDTLTKSLLVTTRINRSIRLRDIEMKLRMVKTILTEKWKKMDEVMTQETENLKQGIQNVKVDIE